MDGVISSFAGPRWLSNQAECKANQPCLLIGLSLFFRAHCVREPAISGRLPHWFCQSSGELNRKLLSEVQHQKEAIKERRMELASHVQAEPLVQKVVEDARWLGLEISFSQAKLMIGGQRMCLSGKWWAVFAGELKSTIPPAELRAKALVERMKNALHAH